MSRMLDVYLHDRLVGQLTQTDGGDLAFFYDADYLAMASSGISLSMPLQEKAFRGGVVKAFFSGLLPEASVRDRLAMCLGVSSGNPFALLEAVGGDCAGALALYPHGQQPPETFDDAEVLDNDRLSKILDLIKRRPMLAGEAGCRLSLAGAQNKLAVGFQDGQVLLIKNGAPTTHILKPMIEHIKDSAHNELFCMKLAEMVGLDVPEVSLHFVGDRPYCLVARYDRQVNDHGVITRLHQEDFCQALGVAPELKYEREGGPSIAACQDVVIKHVARPAVDQMKLLNIVIFNYVVGNADAHGKNFSLLYKGEKPVLAPAYDLLSTAIYPDLSEKMAMKIGGKYKPKDVFRRHFHHFVPNTKVAQSVMNHQMHAMAERMMAAAPTLKANLMRHGLVSDVFDAIIAVIEMRAKRLMR